MKFTPEYEYAFACWHENRQKSDALYRAGHMKHREWKRVSGRINRAFQEKKKALKEKGKIYA